MKQLWSVVVEDLIIAQHPDAGLVISNRRTGDQVLIRDVMLDDVIKALQKQRRGLNAAKRVRPAVRPAKATKVRRVK